MNLQEAREFDDLKLTVIELIKRVEKLEGTHSPKTKKAQ